MRRALAVLLSLAALASGGAAFAAGTSFNLRNAGKAAVVSFQTREEGKWSENWIGSPVAPGETFRMSFNTEDGDCVLKTRVRFQGGASVEGDIDYCDVRVVTADEQGVRAAGR